MHGLVIKFTIFRRHRVRGVRVCTTSPVTQYSGLT